MKPSRNYIGGELSPLTCFCVFQIFLYKINVKIFQKTGTRMVFFGYPYSNVFHLLCKNVCLPGFFDLKIFDQLSNSHFISVAIWHQLFLVHSNSTRNGIESKNDRIIELVLHLNPMNIV